MREFCARGAKTFWLWPTTQLRRALSWDTDSFLPNDPTEKPEMSSSISRNVANSCRLIVCLSLVSVSESQPSVCSAQDTARTAPRVTLPIGAAGLSRYSPQSWGIVGVDLINPAGEPADVLVVMYFADEPSVQYARCFWVPPRAKRSSWCPVLPPGDEATDVGKMELKTLVLDGSEPDDSAIRHDDGRMLDSTWLLAGEWLAVTGFLGGRSAFELDAYEAVIAARISANLTRRVTMFQDGFLPPISQGLQAMGQLILCDDRLISDMAGLTAIRQWLHGGGRLWIMLDRVEAETVNFLLGELFACQVVDRVGLTDLQIKAAEGQLFTPDGAVRNFEEPVDLVRVVPADADITYTVNGWPAAFWQKVGRGTVLFTTLGARAWTQQHTRDSRQRADPLHSSNWMATQPLRHLSLRFFTRQEPPAVKPSQFEPMLTEQIGYRIVGRGTVTAILTAFCAGLLIGGLWLVRCGRLERLGWLGPAAAVFAAAVIIVLGALSKHVVPNTLAELQFVETAPGSDDIQVTGLAAVYNQDSSNAPPRARQGGVLFPDPNGLRGTVRRLVWSDIDSWHWENLSLPPGVTMAPFEFFRRIAKPVEARASFGPTGVKGRVSMGPFEGFSDAVIATPARECMGIQIATGGAFASGSRDVLAPGQFVADTLLSAEQRRRQEVYRQLIPGSNHAAWPNRSMLLGWSSPIATGFEFPDQTNKLGSALVAIPLSFEPTPPGTKVVIPSAFLPYLKDRADVSSPTYVNTTGEWLPCKGPSQTWLRIQVPREVLPIKLDKAIVTVHINGPSRKLEIARKAAGKTIVLGVQDDPVGTVRFEIDQREALLLDDDGGLRLGVLVAGTEDEALPLDEFDGGINRWKIEYLRFELQGETLEP